MNLIDASAALEIYMDADIPVFLWGPPGVGKSDTLHAVAKPRTWKVIDFRASTRDPVALMGLPDVSGGTTQWRVPDEFPQVERDGPEGILFLDELNAAAPAMQAAAFGLVLDRRVGEYTLPPGWRVIGAGNRQSDRAAAQRMPSALANRFAHIFVEPDIGAWSGWASRVALHPAVAAFIQFRPALLHLMPGAQPSDRTLPAIPADACAFPTPRAWGSVAKIADAPDSIRQSLVAGLVGDGPAAEFEGFIRTWRSLPPIAAILTDPHNAPVPPASEPAALYAVSMALSRRATKDNLAAILAYASRLPREFEIVIMVDAQHRDSSLCETNAFVSWATRNQDVTL